MGSGGDPTSCAAANPGLRGDGLQAYWWLSCHHDCRGIVVVVMDLPHFDPNGWGGVSVDCLRNAFTHLGCQGRMYVTPCALWCSDGVDHSLIR